MIKETERQHNWSTIIPNMEWSNEVMKKAESLSNWNKETGRPVGQTRGKDNEEAQHVSM